MSQRGEADAALAGNGLGCAGRIGGHRKRILLPHREFIQERLEQTRRLFAARFEGTCRARGVCLAQRAVGVPAVRGLALQKSGSLSNKRVRTVAPRRQRCKTRRRSFDPAKLVFIHETWIKTNMAPLRGWSPNGNRLRAYAPHGVGGR
jgi:hypothetical protein